MECATVCGEDLRVSDLDAFLAAGWDRVDASFEETAAGPLQQAWVTLFVEDDFVDLPGALFFYDVCFHQLVADPHAEARDRGIWWKREIESALEHVSGVVDERLLDYCACDLVSDIDAHMMVADRQRRVTAVDSCD